MAPHQPSQSAEPLLTRPEVAELLKIKPQTLAVWASTKRYNLPYLKIGSLVRYRESDVLKFMARYSHGLEELEDPACNQLRSPLIGEIRRGGSGEEGASCIRETPRD